jgi:hypothetical protein
VAQQAAAAARWPQPLPHASGSSGRHAQVRTGARCISFAHQVNWSVHPLSRHARAALHCQMPPGGSALRRAVRFKCRYTTHQRHQNNLPAHFGQIKQRCAAAQRVQLYICHA